MRSKKLALVLVVIAIILAIVLINRPRQNIEDGFGLVNSNQDYIDARVGDVAPDFVLESLDGRVVRLSDLRGKPVFVNFWATWCPFCVEEMPDMQKVYDERKQDGLVILAVNRAESENVIKKFLDTGLDGKIKYIILLDRSDDVARAYIPFGMPVSYFIDRDGRIVNRKMGQLTLDEIRTNVGKII